MDVVLPTISERIQTLELSGVRENCTIELLCDVDGIVLWDSHNPQPTKFPPVTLEEGTVLITGTTYRDETDLFCCELDYYHPPRLLWAPDRSACYLVNGDIEIGIVINYNQE